jgi:ribosome-associated protein
VFADSAADDITNCTNRSPFPTLHLLREASLDRAVAAFPEAATIYERNLRYAAAAWRRWLAGNSRRLSPHWRRSNTPMPSCRHAIELREDEVEITAVRAQGAGGQNVNKVSNAVHLRFDIVASSLPEDLKQRLQLWRDQRISGDGVVIIKAQEHRSLERNRQDALCRLRELIAQAAFTQRPRRATKPTHGSQIRRIEGKVKRGAVKLLRARVSES